jgi:hypothetical protein
VIKPCKLLHLEEVAKTIIRLDHFKVRGTNACFRDDHRSVVCRGAAATPVLASIAGAGSAAASAQEQLLRLSGALDLAQRIASARSGEGGARPATLELAEDETPQVAQFAESGFRV